MSIALLGIIGPAQFVARAPRGLPGDEIAQVAAPDAPVWQRELYRVLQEGRYRQVRAQLDLIPSGVGVEAGSQRDTMYFYADMAARYALETEQWALAMEAPDGGPRAGAEATMWYARGLGAARTGQLDLAKAAALRLEALTAQDGRRSIAEVQRLGVLAAMAAWQEEREEMTVLLKQALELEEQAVAVRHVPCYPIIPMRELAGALWLKVHRFADAEREFAAALAQYPGRARALYGLARSAAKAEHVAAARRVFAELLDVWQAADPDRPELAEARAYLVSTLR